MVPWASLALIVMIPAALSSAFVHLATAGTVINQQHHFEQGNNEDVSSN